MLKIVGINIHQRSQKRANSEKMFLILINSKRYLEKPESDE